MAALRHSAVPSIVTFCCKLLHIDSMFAPYLLDLTWMALALAVHIYRQIISQQCAVMYPSGAHCDFCNARTINELTDRTMVKKFTYSIIGILFFVLSGSLFSGALQLHGAIADSMQHFESFPEPAWLIVLGSLLISGATFLRRRRAAARTR
jgi:hypothetical protein